MAQPAAPLPREGSATEARRSPRTAELVATAEYPDRVRARVAVRAAPRQAEVLRAAAAPPAAAAAHHKATARVTSTAPVTHSMRTTTGSAGPKSSSRTRLAA